MKSAVFFATVFVVFMALVTEEIHGRPDGFSPFGRGNECVDGTYTQIDCNGCSCMNGWWACTLMACPPKDLKDSRAQSSSKQE